MPTSVVSNAEIDSLVAALDDDDDGDLSIDETSNFRSSDSSFDAKEPKQIIRDDLKVPTSAVSNAESDSLVAALDDDDGGDLSIDEISNFVERGAATFKIDDSTINEGNERSAKCPPCAAWRV